MGARGVPWTSNADHQTRSKHNSIPAAFTAKFHLNRVFKDTFNLSKRRSQLKFRFGNFKLCMETTRTLCQILAEAKIVIHARLLQKGKGGHLCRRSARENASGEV